MTGFGDARAQSNGLSVAVEVRSVNNRYLKISTRCPEAYAALEPEIERVVRSAISRGTVTVAVRVESADAIAGPGINVTVLESYHRQLGRAAEKLHLFPPSDVGQLLALPGVVEEAPASGADLERGWPVIRQALEEALGKLARFRESEGASMEADLRTNAAIIRDQTNRVSELAPGVVRDYRDKLLDRIRELIGTSGVTIEPADLIREVSVFAERCDVNEEVTRLRSHLDQLEQFLGQRPAPGRKLEFLTQEMFREVNTIGSKANNVEIAHSAVEMKAAVEKMREILQNVE